MIVNFVSLFLFLRHVLQVQCGKRAIKGDVLRSSFLRLIVSRRDEQDLVEHTQVHFPAGQAPNCIVSNAYRIQEEQGLTRRAAAARARTWY